MLTALVESSATIALMVVVTCIVHRTISYLVLRSLSHRRCSQLGNCTKDVQFDCRNITKEINDTVINIEVRNDYLPP